jgi:hypothetical protein
MLRWPDNIPEKQKTKLNHELKKIDREGEKEKKKKYNKIERERERGEGEGERERAKSSLNNR